MLKKLYLIPCLLLVVLVAVPVHCRGAVKVGVAPFIINSQEQLTYLSEGIQEMIMNHLLQRGVLVATLAEMQPMFPRGLKTDETRAREIGRTLGVDYVVLGSLTKIGDHSSLDARVVNVSGTKETASVFVESRGIENINAAAEELAIGVTENVSGLTKVAEVKVSGNERIETDAILRVIQSKPGDIFSKDKVSADLKRIYAMEYFEDVKIDVVDSSKGKLVTFLVEEKPVIERIDISGNRMVEEQELLDVLGYNLFAVANEKRIADSIQNIKDFYREKGYYNAEINYELVKTSKKRVAIKYNVKESSRVYVQKINFIGNDSFSDRQLKKFMETREANMLSWILESGILDENKLSTDTKRLTAWYYNHGYIRARVGEPVVSVREDGIYIDITIEEGPQFSVGQITLTGDLVLKEEDIRSRLKLKEGEILQRELLQEDVQTITSLTSDQGYAFADVTPNSRENDDTLTVDVEYHINKKGLVSFERISIKGNDVTRDKVIRRQLKVREGEMFSSKALSLSQKNLDRLGYFSEVQIVQSKGSADDKMNLEVQLKEQPTGMFSIGAGYSSYNKVFGSASVSQNNLFGRGQQLKLEADVGAMADSFVLSFTEPWLFDIPLASGFDIFLKTLEYDDYDKESRGFALRAGYPLKEFVRLTGRYQYEIINVNDVPENATQSLKDIEGESTTSSVMAMLRRDTRNHFFNPTAGSDNYLQVTHAGGLLGGTNAFSRFVVNSGWYYPNPLFSESAFHVKGRVGLMTQGDGDLPAYEKFYLGGINSVRGYEWTDITPRDPVTGEKLGGEKMVQINVEFTFPLLKSVGLIGVVFFDQGNVWEDSDDYDLTDLRRSYGAGFRWNSPMGPLRIEYGRILDPQAGDPEGNWEFAVGAQF